MLSNQPTSKQNWLDRYFGISAAGSSIKVEIIAGITTFLTMAYIIVVQPAVLSGQFTNQPTGMDFGSVMTATCLSAAVATLIMALMARYPIALAPGMGANFFFVITVIPGALAAGFQNAWNVALGVILIAGVLFVLVSVSGLRQLLMDAISPNLKHAIAVGIGLFIAFIGFQNAGLIEADPGTGVRLNSSFASPDILVFFAGLILSSALIVHNRKGAILIGMLFATALTIGLDELIPYLPASYVNSKVVQESMLLQRFSMSSHILSWPPSVAPTFLAVDWWSALSSSMVPFIIMFLFVDIFDTMGTLLAVGQAGGFLKNGQLPRANRAFLADAFGTVIGALFGTSTVTAYIESAAGVEQGGRTGLTAVVIALCFLGALFLSPLIIMVGSYPPITAPALVIVGGMMLKNISALELGDFSEFLPAFVVILGIPLSYSIADGIALGFITYPITKLVSGRYKEAHWLKYILTVLMILYFIFLRTKY
ncbi:MAG: NCS2 family permease [Leptospiraceae bacterium]|nr:NCS2 family permease [Leptospiraceae bacterium]